MRIPITLKMMLRQPMKICFFIVLLALVVFAFTSQVFEGLIVNREINRLSEQYNSIGRLMPVEDWEWDITQARTLLDEHPLVEYTEALRVIPGVMEGVYTPDIDGHSYFPNQMFVYGTLVAKNHLDDLEIPPLRLGFFPEVAEQLLPNVDFYYFQIQIDTVAEALPEHVVVGDRLGFFLIGYQGSLNHVYEQVEVGQRYFLGGHFGKNLNLPYFMYLEPSFLRYSPTGSDLSEFLNLQLLPLAEGIYFHPIPEGSSIDIPEIMEQVEVLRNNIHTVFLRPTRDMYARTDVIDSMFLMDGRFINREDYDAANPVAVVRSEFAGLRGLSVGDTITMTMREAPFATKHIIPDAMRSFPVPSIGTIYQRETFLELVEEGVYSGVGHTTLAWIDGLAYNETWSGRIKDYYYNSLGSPFSDGIMYDDVMYNDARGIDEIVNLEISTGYITNQENYNWREMETQTKTFEIVGIYGTTDRLSNILTVSHNNVFVPDSVVPGHWVQDVPYRNFNFVLTSPAVEESFRENYQRVLEDMGFWPLFAESGWVSFNEAVSPIRSGIITGIIAFGLLLMIVFYLAVFIYFIQRRKEYAIARALGSGKARSLWSNTIPMIIIAIIAIGIGITASWHFAISRGEAVLADIEGAVFTSPPTLWIMYVYAILLGFFLLFLGVETCKLANRSELELLQGSRSGKTKKKIFKITFPEDEDHFERIRLNLSYITEYPKKLQGLGTAFMVRLSRKYFIRKPLKSILAIAIAFAFTVVLAWMPTSIEENKQQIDLLYDNTVVTATTVVDPISGATRRGSVPDTLLQEIISLTPSMDDAESEIDNEEDCVSEMFIANYYAEAQHHMALTNIEGWEDTIDPEGEWWEYFEWEEIVGFNNQEVFEEFHDMDLNITFEDGFDMEVFEQSDIDEPVILISQRFKTESGVNFGDYLELVAAEQASRLRPSDFMPYKIIGSFDVQGYGINLITPLVNLQNHLGRDLRHNQVDFELNPALNRELELFRIQADELMVGTNPQLVFILRDHILREVVNPLERNIIMMSTLYPIILALSGIIAMGIVILLLLTSTKDVAIMRATGVSRLRVMIILGMEQIILCIMGLLIGVIVSAIAFGAVNLLGVILFFSGYTLGAIIVLAILANRKPLDLLQVKE